MNDIVSSTFYLSMKVPISFYFKNNLYSNYLDIPYSMLKTAFSFNIYLERISSTMCLAKLNPLSSSIILSNNCLVFSTGFLLIRVSTCSNFKSQFLRVLIQSLYFFACSNSSLFAAISFFLFFFTILSNVLTWFPIKFSA